MRNWNKYTELVEVGFMPRKSLMDRVAEYTPLSSSEGKFQTKEPALADRI